MSHIEENEIAEIEFGLAGMYQIEKGRADSDGNLIEESREVVCPWFDNLITDVGLVERANQVFRDIFNNCHVGSGNTLPAFSDSSLASYVKSAAAGLPTSSSEDFGSYAAYTAGGTPYWEVTISYTFATETGPVTYSELGIGRTNTALFSRALIKDPGGSPTSISLIAGEILIVTYKHRIYPPTGDVTGSFTLMPGTANETLVNYTIRAAHIGTAGSWPGVRIATTPPSGVNTTSAATTYYPAGSTLGLVTAGPSGSGTNFITGATSSVSPGNPYAFCGANLAVSQVNLAGGIGAIRLSTAQLGTWQLGFSPAVPKNADRTFNYSIRLTCGRYTP